jgi:sugar phosphate isomerase/epimerase
MYVSALLTSLPGAFEEALAQLAALDFTHVDVVALADRPLLHREALADSGLVASCAAVGKGLPADWTPDCESVEVRRKTLEQMKRQVADAAALGATHAYLVPGRDTSPASLERFGEFCVLLADYAAQRMVRLCLEHFPGRALPTAEATLAWLDALGDPGLGLLLDVGHCLLSREDPAAVISRAGRRLGYVHLDDNDGVGDLHWPLLTGQLTKETLVRTLRALAEVEYEGALSLEFNAQNPDPVGALREGKLHLDSMMALSEPEA